MKKYKGFILDSEGHIVFEFVTRFSPTIKGAYRQARKICEAWRQYENSDEFVWVIEVYEKNTYE